jgi:preprotein translocase subunit YajC
MPFVPFLQDAAPTGSQSIAMSVLPFVLIIIIFYFFIIRPQNKKQKETEKMINALKKGDKVVTIGGIHGVVSSAKEKTVIVKVDENTKLEFNKSAIATVVVDTPVENKKADKKVESEKNADSEETSTVSEESKSE